jgi:hypothetical protein
MSPRLLRPRAAGGFNPKTLPGLQGWWDAADSSTITLNGSNVSEWADKSGNGRALSQATAAAQPAYQTAVINGRNAVVWPNSVNQNRLQAASAFSIQQIAIVCRLGTGSSGTSDFRGLLSSPGNIGLLSGSSSTSWFAGSASDWNLMRKDGAAEASIDSVTAVPLPLTVLVVRNASALSRQLLVGGERASTTRSWWGPICEVLAFSATLNASQTTALERYLGRKWGVTIAAPPPPPPPSAAPSLWKAETLRPLYHWST